MYTVAYGVQSRMWGTFHGPVASSYRVGSCLVLHVLLGGRSDGTSNFKLPVLTNVATPSRLATISRLNVNANHLKKKN